MPTKTQQAIDYYLEIAQGKGFRNHLGASVIGRECARQVWYIFRWAALVRHKARMLRLFDRGNLEENRFVSWLRKAGIHVLDRDPETGDQFRIADHNDHFGGSLDALIYDAPDFPGEWALGEFKTHNDKSFREVVKKGVKKGKFEHYVQMQIYMHKREVPMALYFAINKNDDELWIEAVYYEKEIAERYLDKAGKIINLDRPPPRISESPGWYLCTFCDFKDTCHNGEPMRVSCRTCVHVRPVEKGQWLCTRYNYLLSTADQHRACSSHDPIHG